MPRHELNTLTIEPPLSSPAVEGLKVVEPSLESLIVPITARFGYMDAPNAPEVLRLLETADIECPIEVDYGLVLRLHDRAASWHRQDHGPMAQAPVPRHLRHHCRRRRVLQPAP